jgi:hypothetical protein
VPYGIFESDVIGGLRGRPEKMGFNSRFAQQ